MVIAGGSFLRVCSAAVIACGDLASASAHNLVVIERLADAALADAQRIAVGTAGAIKRILRVAAGAFEAALLVGATFAKTCAPIDAISYAQSLQSSDNRNRF